MRTRRRWCFWLAMLGAAGCSSQPALDQGHPRDAVARDRAFTEAARPDAAAADLGKHARCMELSSRYQELLVQARSCLLQAGEPQCQKLVDRAVGCGCLTTVEASNAAALQAMALIADEWGLLTCQVFCAGPPCPAQPLGSCVPAPGGARCEDS